MERDDGVWFGNKANKTNCEQSASCTATPRAAFTRLAVRSPPARGGRGQERRAGTATSWQCKDNELVPDEDEARQLVQVKCQSKATMKDTGAGGRGCR